MMSGMYDVARVVDPVECQILDFSEEGRVGLCGTCYNVWQSEQRCINCSSFAACRTGVHKEKTEKFQDNIYHIQSNPIKIIDKDGTQFDAVMELISVHKDEGDSADANDRAAENVDFKALQFQAHHDSLTNLLNTNAFIELARERLLKNPETHWLMITGNFKEFRMVNYLFGVEKGNEILVRTAELLQSIARSGQGLCSRLASDRFALLLPSAAFHEEMLTSIAQEISESAGSLVFTPSIHFGVYEIADSSLPIMLMCDRANIALQTIQNEIRKFVAYFDDSLMKQKLFEQKIISQFDTVLKAGQLQMYLQPLVDSKGSVYGAEALVRWVRPEGTVLTPGAFIETLETAGLIPELDTYIWEQAIRQLSIWKNTDKQDLTISVNISPRDFYYIDIYDVLTGLLEKYNVDRTKLRLEITETTIVEDSETISAILKKLRDAGFYIEIDDFGKGNSSLSLLKDISADMLKIDMGFIQDTKDKERSRIILETVIKMGLMLGMDVITEGVETKEQFDFLVSAGCQYFQGFYFSCPLPIEKFESWLLNHNKHE